MRNKISLAFVFFEKLVRQLFCFVAIVDFRIQRVLEWNSFINVTKCITIQILSCVKCSVNISHVKTNVTFERRCVSLYTQVLVFAPIFTAARSKSGWILFIRAGISNFHRSSRLFIAGIIIFSVDEKSPLNVLDGSTPANRVSLKAYRCAFVLTPGGKNCQ